MLLIKLFRLYRLIKKTNNHKNGALRAVIVLRALFLFIEKIMTLGMKKYITKGKIDIKTSLKHKIIQYHISLYKIFRHKNYMPIL